jgi:fumarate reductase subunit C
MNRIAGARQPYRRPMQGWWRRDPFFLRYMIREATSIAVLVYSVVLMMGALRLAQGEAAFNDWLAALRSPGSILLHLLLFVAMAVHAHSWFEIMPKTLPLMFAGGERVAASTIQRIGWTVAFLVMLGVIAIAWGLRP